MLELAALWMTKGSSGRLMSGFVKDGIKRARQQTWQKAAKHRPHDKRFEGGVDENTTRKYYVKLAQKKPLDAGALHTNLADGVWTPERAENRRKKADCVSCVGLQRLGLNTSGGNALHPMEWSILAC
eukprot:5609872-Heterocapsa_arctica.AAC.1